MKYLILTSLFFTSCSTLKQPSKSHFYSIETQMLSGKNLKCSAKIITEAQNKARVTSKDKNTICDLKLNIKKIQGNQFKLHAKHTYDDGSTILKRKMSLIGLLGQKMIINKGEKDYIFLVEKTNIDTESL